jgi:hypothetical protein
MMRVRERKEGRNAHAAEEPTKAKLARLLDREEQVQLDEPRLAQLERAVERGDVACADGGDERREDIREDGEAVHQLV